MKNSRKRHLESLKKTQGNTTGPDLVVESEHQDQIMELGDHLLDTEKKTMNSHDQKSRMERIIEICEINKIQNEEWIRGLNFYLTNLKKAIKFEKDEIKVIESELDQFSGINEHF